jgi:hypothetical protein
MSYELHTYYKTKIQTKSTIKISHKNTRVLVIKIISVELVCNGFRREFDKNQFVEMSVK